MATILARLCRNAWAVRFDRNTVLTPTLLKMAVSRTICARRLERVVSTLVTPVHVAWLLSALFGIAAAVHLLGFRFVRQAYERWHYPRGFREVTGTLLLLAALFLGVPETRYWGIAIAAFVMFLSATTLLHHRQYTFAAPIIALLFALIPVSLAGPI